MGDVAEPLRLADAGGRLEAEGMRLLLEKKDPAKASKAILDASKQYRKSKDGFEEAGWTQMELMGDMAKTTGRHAHFISETGRENLKDVTVGVGKWFIVFFVASLLLLISLSTYLNVGGLTDLQYSLVVGVIGGFGLKSPAILKVIGSLVTPKSGSD